MKKIICLFACLFAGTANASLIAVDWQAASDDLLTFDTVSGLEWLDLTQTYNQTVADVLPLTATGGVYDGFRLALASEVHGLMSAAGLPIGTNTGSISSDALVLDAADALTALLGDTVGQHFGAGLFGARGHLNDGGFDRVVGYYNVNDSYLLNDYFSNYPNWQGAGVWLVRNTQVPEPASLALMGLGLVGLGFARRKKQPK